MFASLVFIFIELTDPQAAPPPRDEAPPMTLMLKSTAPLPLDVAVRSARSSPQIPLFATSPSSPRPRLQAPSDLLHSLPSRLLQTTTASTIDAIGLRLFPPHLGLLTHQTSPSLPFSPSTTPNNCIFFVTRSHPEISCAVGYRDHRQFLHLRPHRPSCATHRTPSPSPSYFTSPTSSLPLLSSFTFPEFVVQHQRGEEQHGF